MKNNLLYCIMFLLSLFILTGCAEDDDFHPTIFNIQRETGNPVDQYIYDEWTKPYNVDIIYRWNDYESNQDYQLVPPLENMVVPFLKTMVRGFIQPYLETSAGISFMRTAIPKQIMLVGSAGFRSDGLYLLGEAERGNKITIYNLNRGNPNDSASLIYNLWRFHHEFVHVLNQTIEIPEEFPLISAADYTTSWSEISNPISMGLISSYAGESSEEDFAEMIAFYVLYSDQTWTAIMNANGNASAQAKFQAKERIILDYMKNSWNIDLLEIRRNVAEAVQDVIHGRI